MPEKHKEVSCKICYKTMRSDSVKRHMKVHEKPNKQICGEVLDMQEESTTEIKHDDGEHDTANCQPSKKRKFNEIDDEALEKMLEEQTVEYDRKIAFKIAFHTMKMSKIFKKLNFHQIYPKICEFITI